MTHQGWMAPAAAGKESGLSAMTVTAQNERTQKWINNYVNHAGVYRSILYYRAHLIQGGTQTKP